ncbi:protein-export membrane protein SecF [Halarchaeum acidiphilum MH1-52-1]|uniref:Protein-export membrane protein SecF n=1 Tax=Halarchaeum acidiphilum MH1-52-1 TaxID=1261545 RepID=U2YU10_9EURY|nr:protein translocase subunit SecF [Halarchaeum acidiphilum]GAD52232.1 protein-export membrane protein SecF [Halarchaeum acidiphilum MH1-52-1]
MPSFDVPEVDYTRYSNRQLAGVPLAVLALALLVLAAWYVLNGTPVSLGLEFTGGTELTLHATSAQAASQGAVRQAFSTPASSVQAIPSRASTYVATFGSGTNATALQNQAQAAGYEVVSTTSTSATFGAQSQRFALLGLLGSFVGMAIIVFVLFRSFVPSGAVVLSAFGDIVIPLALMNIFGIKLSLGTVAALLMLIGYSVDSDILLTNHVLRRSGSFYESVDRAMKTGVTMTVTSLAAMAVMAVVAYAFGIELLTSIGLVLVFGLATDLMNTYMLNLSLLRWYKYEGVGR